MNNTPLFSEAIKLKDGVIYNLSYHQSRVNRTLKHFFDSQIDLDFVCESIPSDKKTGLYKVRVVYDKQVRTIEYIPYSIADKKNVKIVFDNNINYDYKSTNRSYINQLLHSSECDDIIIIKNGMVTDSSASNLVFESHTGDLFTPTDCLLRGTKRQYLLDKGFILEKKIYHIEIASFKGIFFINAMIDLEDNIYINTADLNL